MNKSQRGKVDEALQALLRLTFSLHMRDDYHLSSADVTFSFLPLTYGPSPKVTEHVYPDILCGPPTSQRIVSSQKMEPTIEAMGVTAGGIGMSKSSEQVKTLQLHLRGSRLPDEQNDNTKASWTWQSSKVNSETELIRGFELGLVLDHPEPSMRVSTTITDDRGKGAGGRSSLAVKLRIW